MKFMTERHELDPDEFGTTENDQKLYVVIPKGLKEGQVQRIREVGRSAEDDNARVSNAEVLKLVKEWNFDDEKGAPLPLMSTLIPDGQALVDLPEKKRAEAERVIATVPISFFAWMAKQLVNKPAFTESAEGFLKTS